MIKAFMSRPFLENYLELGEKSCDVATYTADADGEDNRANERR